MRYLSLICLASLSLSGCLAQAPPELYHTAPGPLAVATHLRLVLPDAARGKDLLVTAVFPTAEGKYPVLVWSHGFGGAPANYMTYARHWASYGYVVLLPVHADSLSLGEGPPDLSAMGPALMKMLHDPDQWVNRAKDVRLLLDSLPQVEKLVPELAGKLNGEQIGVGGHSFGAYTAQVIAGATLTLPGQTGPQTFADPRAKAIVAMSGVGLGQMGITETSWEHLTLPMLTMTGSLDRGVFGFLGPECKKQSFDHSPAGHKFHLFLEGAAHSSFNDGLHREGEANHGQLLSWADTTALAFWDAYLMADPAARAYLNSDALSQATLSRR